MKVKVLSEVIINGTPAVVGTVIDCDPTTAANLIRKGRLEAAKETEDETPEPASKSTPKTHKKSK